MNVSVIPIESLSDILGSEEFGKRFTTSGGFEVILVSPEEWKKLKPEFEKRVNWMPYDSNLIEMHIANCGYGVIDPEYLTAIDDEFSLDDVYSSLEAERK